ncbi:MAG TPA: TonB-dependent receptor [Terriglobia bacterium]|nr:TonB-dependent receptor [Terriglobia bacterium]
MRKMVQIFMLTFVCSAVLLAQTNTGGINGEVKDQTGASVPGATVIITNIGTNAMFKTTTSKVGTFEEQNLEPVTYRVEVEARGFEKAVIARVKVDTMSVATANFTVRPGSALTQVQVTARSPLLNTNNGTLGETISSRMMTDVPLANRSVLDLAVLVPNVSGDVGTEDPGVTSGFPVPGFNLSLNGGRPGASTMLADGVSNTGVGLAREVVSFSPETVQEVAVQTSAYSAQYGRTGGGLINVTTKSGSNQFHGIATWYNRNPTTNAAPWTTAVTNRPTNPERWNQFSFDIGGPVWIPKIYNGHNRTFFFFAVEPRYQQDTLQEDALMPSAAMRGGDFSNLTQVNGGWAPTSVVNQFQSGLPANQVLATGQTSQIYEQYALQGNQLAALPALATGQAYAQFPNNTIPQSWLDPVSLKLLQYMPLPQGYYIDGNGNLVNYTLQRFVHENETRYTLKIDQQVTNHNHAFFRFTDVPEIGVTGFGSPVNGNGSTFSYSHQYVVDDTQTLTPTVYNDLRLNYTYGNFSGQFSPTYDINSGQNLSTQLGLPSLTKGGLPLMTWDTLNAFTNIGSEGSQLNVNTEKQYQIEDSLYISHGAMMWTTGFGYAKDTLGVTNYFAAAGGDYSFRFVQTDSNGGADRNSGISFASFLLGVPNSVLLNNSVIPYNYRWADYDAFVQNDWKVKSNLTLNLGLRYSLQFPRAASNNFQGVFLASQAQTVPIPAANQTLQLTSGSPRTINLPTGPGGAMEPLKLTSVMIPPFDFTGAAGTSKYLNPVNWKDFEPRFGFAYASHFHDLVIRGGYGISHVPLTGQNRQPDPTFAGANLNFGATAGQTNPAYIMRLCCNPPYDPPLTPQQAVNMPSSGLEYESGINVSGFLLSPNTKTPQVQNWNLSLSRQFGANTVVTMAYVGSKGTYLYMPALNENQFNPDFIQELEANNYNPTGQNIVDPLGRTAPPVCTTTSKGTTCKPGAVITIPIGYIASPYLGYGNLTTLYDATANSIRHAGYVSVVHRETRGLTLSANYTYGNSIDDASNASPDKTVLTSSNLPGGQITYGGTAEGDRAVSTYNIRHDINAIFIYDLPFGPGRAFLPSAPKIVSGAIGGWTVSGVERLHTGYPAVATLSEGNYLGTTTHDIRPDLVAGVPIVNPLYNASCGNTNLCQPYLNPSAFEVPPAGQLGTAPRTFGMASGPWEQTLDLSVQKNFRITERVRLQLRVDAINALNHPVFENVPNNFGGTDIFGEPSTGAISTTEYNNWAALNNQGSVNSKGQGAGAAEFTKINATLTAARLPGGALPANFFTVPIPSGFATDSAASFDLTTLQGIALMRDRETYNTGFGLLYVPGNSQRYIQFGIRIFF